MSDIRLNKFFSFVAAFLALTILMLNLYFSIYGIDFTDEGFYLNWISNPYIFSYSMTNFGHFYNLFFSTILFENIVYLRWFNIALISLAAFTASYVALKKYGSWLDSISIYIYSFVLSSVALTLYGGTILFSLTPSYNDLNYLGLLVVLIGVLVGIEERTNKVMILSAFLIALGGAMLFHAKPSTAVLVGLAVVLMVLASFNKRFWFLSINLLFFIVLLFASSFWVSSGPIAMFNQYLFGLEVQAYLQSGHEIWSIIRFDDFELSRRNWSIVLLVFALFTFFAYSQLNNKYKKIANYILVSFVFFVVAYILTGNIFNAGRYQGVILLIMALMPLFALFYVVFFHEFRPKKNIVYIILFGLILVYSYAFGTNNNYFVVFHKVAFILILPVFLLLLAIFKHLKVNHSQAALFYLIILQVIVLLNTIKAIDTPYRQPHSLIKNDAPTMVGSSRLILSKEFSSYINEVSMIKELGAERFIDLSGQSPTLAYVLNLKPIGVAWLLGGYPGSDDFAKEVLRREACDVFTNSIILYEPDGPRSLSLDVIESVGLNLARDFREVLRVKSPAGAGGYKFTRDQIFYFSKSVEVARNCNAN